MAGGQDKDVMRAMLEELRGKDGDAPVTPRQEDDIAFAIHTMPVVRVVSMCEGIFGVKNGQHAAFRLIEWSIIRLTPAIPTE